MHCFLFLYYGVFESHSFVRSCKTLLYILHHSPWGFQHAHLTSPMDTSTLPLITVETQHAFCSQQAVVQWMTSVMTHCYLAGSRWEPHKCPCRQRTWMCLPFSDLSQDTLDVEKRFQSLRHWGLLTLFCVFSITFFQPFYAISAKKWRQFYSY